jgi:hypothetical protein
VPAAGGRRTEFHQTIESIAESLAEAMPENSTRRWMKEQQGQQIVDSAGSRGPPSLEYRRGL